jgi:AcrR family transcriptional regulator
MGRWEPGAAQRLQQSALQLFTSKGFESTTAVEIAAGAGLTERTFFRHFADKREVLFAGQEEFTRPFLAGIASAPQGAAPLEIVSSAVLGAAAFFPAEKLAYSRTRQAVIVANPELQERELLKLASLASTIAAALRERGIADPGATLAAESGVTVFRVSFELWLADTTGAAIDDIERRVFRELGALTAVAR